MKTGWLPKQTKSKRQTSFKSFKLFTRQGMKSTTHQLSSPELHDCPSKHLVAGNFGVFICTCDFPAWPQVCFPALPRLLGVSSPGTLGCSMEETTGTRAPSSQAAFCCCTHSSRWQNSYLDTARIDSPARQTQHERRAMKLHFPSSQSGIHPKNYTVKSAQQR